MSDHHGRTRPSVMQLLLDTDIGVLLSGLWKRHREYPRITTPCNNCGSTKTVRDLDCGGIFHCTKCGCRRYDLT